MNVRCGPVHNPKCPNIVPGYSDGSQRIWHEKQRWRYMWTVCVLIIYAVTDIKSRTQETTNTWERPQTMFKGRLEPQAAYSIKSKCEWTVATKGKGVWTCVADPTAKYPYDCIIGNIKNVFLCVSSRSWMPWPRKRLLFFEGQASN